MNVRSLHEMIKQADQKNFEDLISNSNRFTIPAFQRAYSWEKKEIDEFLKDILDACNDGEQYFIGTIVVVEDKKETDIVTFSVLDGQQRLTTILLIISQLFKRAQGLESRTRGPRIESRLENCLYARDELKLQPQNFGNAPTDSKVFETIINDLDKAKNDYPKHLMVIATDLINSWMRKEFSSSADDAKFERFANFFLDKVTVVRILVNSESDAFKLFETLNDRGLPLSKADLIKNLLFQHAISEQYDELKKAWNEVSKNVGHRKLDPFLRSYWIAEHGFVRNAGLYDKFKDYFDKTSHGQNTNKLAVQFLREKLIPASEVYNQLTTEANMVGSQETQDVLVRLIESKSKTYLPLLMSALRYRKENFADLAKLVESISVRCILIGKQNPNWLEILYSDLSWMCRDNARNIQEIFAFDDLKKVPKDEQIIENLKTLQIDTSAAWRNILIHIASQQLKNEVLIPGAKFVHIEHIFPQKPRPDCKIESGIDESELEDYIWRLGNCTLLSGRLNRENSNRPFLEKRRNFEQSIIPMNHEIAINQRWGKYEIDQRTEQLANKICELYLHPFDILK